MVELDVVRVAGVDEHCKWEGVADARSHGFSTAHQCHDRRLLLMVKLVAARWPAQDMPNFTRFETNHIGHELVRQIPSNTAVRLS